LRSHRSLLCTTDASPIASVVAAPFRRLGDNHTAVCWHAESRVTAQGKACPIPKTMLCMKHLQKSSFNASAQRKSAPRLRTLSPAPNQNDALLRAPTNLRESQQAKCAGQAATLPTHRSELCETRSRPASSAPRPCSAVPHIDRRTHPQNNSVHGGQPRLTLSDLQLALWRLKPSSNT